jgi:hypothetical protein
LFAEDHYSINRRQSCHPKTSEDCGYSRGDRWSPAQGRAAECSIKALPVKTSLPPAPVGFVTVMDRTLTPLAERIIEYTRKVAGLDLGGAAARKI